MNSSQNSLTDEEVAAHYAQVRHQVKNDMSVIIGFVQLLQADVEKTCGASDATDKILEKLKIIHIRAKKVVTEIDINLADPTEK